MRCIFIYYYYYFSIESELFKIASWEEYLLGKNQYKKIFFSLN